MQGGHQLAFILVNPFDLDVEDGLGIHFYSQLVFDIVGQPLLVVVFDLVEPLFKCLVISILLYLLQLVQVGQPLIPDLFGNQI